MSAFKCTTTHITAIAVWAESAGMGNAAAISTALNRLNNRALFCRYGNYPTPLKGKNAAIELWRANPASVPMVLALAECLEYQCSEGDAMQTPDAKILGSITGKLYALNIRPMPGVWDI